MPVAIRLGDFQKRLPCAYSGRNLDLPSSSPWSLWKQTAAGETCAPPLQGATGLESCALPARGQSVFLTAVPREICLGVGVRAEEGGGGLEGAWARSPHASPEGPLQVLSGPSLEKLLMDLYHGQITHFQKILLQMGKSPRNHARDSLGQILLLGIISPYYRSMEGCRPARGLLLMNFTFQNWPREHESDFANQLELITSRKPGLGLQETHTNTPNIWGLV